MKWITGFFKTYFQQEVGLILVNLPSTDRSSMTVSGKAAPVTHPLIQEVLNVLGGKVIETKQG